MHIRSAKLVCFSPTGTSRTIARAVARGMGLDQAEMMDITSPDKRTQQLRTAADELLVVAVPVYTGRVPALVCDWLQTIKAEGTPAACIVVYGNREYEDALLELADIVKECGGVPVACAAFIGEHSFSSEDTPVAVARPDAEDLELAEAFGRKVSGVLSSMASVKDVKDVAVPGNRPYRERPPKGPVDFIAVGDDCVQCCLCAQVCPVGAIDFQDCTRTDLDRCIKCCACIKSCPAGARTMKASPIRDIAVRLSENFQARKEPAVFF